MAAAESRKRRCAVYTRKSSEEGLEQDFNSLHAQREACEAYIRSQKSEGWLLVSTHYDDGGFSGGTLERPALTRLLSDIESGKVDTVVVYKVDRLTRSLSDFAKIVDTLDTHEVSFVSVTQQFNTTTSMGRLTLNMLLSFAQFEREVTGERIRDKIAASKRKGLWMGGFVPLGYAPNGRTLKVVESEAKTVRTIFQLYLKLGSVREVKNEVDRLGLKSKKRSGEAAKRWGDQIIGRSAIYYMLSNPIYIGRIPHRSESHAGQHPAIIDQKTWEATQKQLSVQAPGKSRFKRTANRHPLVGKLIDEQGIALTPTSTNKSGRLLRYYVSRLPKRRKGESSTIPRTSKWRFPAQEIETKIAETIRSLFENPLLLTRLARKANVRDKLIPELLAAAKRFDGDPFPSLTRVDLEENQLILHLTLSGLVKESDAIVQHPVPFSMRRRGNEVRLVIADEGSWVSRSQVDAPLVKAIARGHKWFQDLARGRVGSLQEIAKDERVTDCYVGQLIPLAFLAPEIISQFLSGNQPANLTSEVVTKRTDLPLAWPDQIELLR